MSDESNQYEGPERRKEPHLTDAQIEAIAERAAIKAVEKMKQEFFVNVGKTVTEKFFIFVGAIVLGVYIWLKTGSPFPK